MRKIRVYDCVEMKHKSQQALLKEYDSRRREFASFSDFLNAKVSESTKTSEIWERFSKEPR
jgi:hypothetical protein